MNCLCPLYCRYCGARRSLDSVGHYCKTRNCQWQHGYTTCRLKRERLTAKETVAKIRKVLK